MNITFRDVKKVEAAAETVDWGKLKATRKNSRQEECVGLDVNLKPIPQLEEAVSQQQVVISQAPVVCIS